MTDFFHRLAERTLGVAAVVRPELGPTFLPMRQSEAEASTELLAETSALAETRQCHASPGTRFTDPDPRVQEQTAAREPHATRHVPTRDYVSQPTLSVDEAPDKDAYESELSLNGNLIDSQQPANDPPSRIITAKPTPTESGGQEHAHPTMTKHSVPKGDYEGGERRSSYHSGSRSSPVVIDPKPDVREIATATAIQVTIGRVEVRAVVTPNQPSKARQVERRTSPLVTLDQYLRGRNGRTG